MIEWFTGQPGHGKTLQAIARALEFQKDGRIVYVCNVRDFDYEKTGMRKMTPEEFRKWPEFLPPGSVCLVDEAYEHDMLPKRPPGAKVPHHVERLATHRHHGLDFIFVCQSPDKQVDSFVHDLIERHVHVRRRFGTKYQHLRTFDRYERNPEKATPLTIKRTTLPKHVFGLYKSTELDTTERRVPWYIIALGIGLPAGLIWVFWVFGSMGERLAGTHAPPPPAPAAAVGTEANGASATVADAPSAHDATPLEYVSKYLPRIPSQPWSAPAYDGLSVPAEPPRIFCMSAEPGELVDGSHADASCTCLTEQGTRYRLAPQACRLIARSGQYEPLLDERSQQFKDAQTQTEENLEVIARREGHTSVIAGDMSHAGDQSNVVTAPEPHF